MAEPGLLTSKVRSYMESLSPTARSMLVRTLRASGSHDLPSEIILKAVEGLELAEEHAVSPVGEPWSVRLETAFFAPAAHFFCDDDPVDRLPGRIARHRLPALWTWIRRDLAPAAFERALAADPLDPNADAVPIARKMRREVVPVMVSQLREVASDPKARQRLVGQIGGEPVFRCLSDLAYVLENEAAFVDLVGQLPRAITAFDVAEPSRLVDLARAAVDRATVAVDWIAAAILTRTSNPVVLVHLACRLAGSTDPRLVAASRYGAFVDAAIACIENFVHRAAGRGVDTVARDGFLDDMRAYHEVTRNLELALPIEGVSAWFRRLGAARAAMSDLVARQLEAAPGLVRRSLRVDNHGGWSDRFDAAEFADAEFAVRVTLEARLAVDSLAVNELALRARKQVENTLELVSGQLMTALKSPAVHDRTMLLAAVDGAIRLCGLVFGEEYAAVLRKSRDIGIQKPARATG